MNQVIRLLGLFLLFSSSGTARIGLLLWRSLTMVQFTE